MAHRTALWILGLALATAGSSWADPRLDEVVYSPYVEKGVTELQSRFGGERGGPLGGQTTSVVEVEYGVTDRISLALVGAIQRPAKQGARLQFVGIEAVGYLGQALGVDAGLYLEYKHGLNGETDAAEAKLLLARTQGRFQALFNLIVEEPLAAPTGEGFAAYGYAASVTWRTVGNLRLGAEAFGDLGSDHAFLGRQGAYLGPEVKWKFRPRKLPVEVVVDAGWLAAIGQDRQEASSQFRLALEFERRF